MQAAEIVLKYLSTMTTLKASRSASAGSVSMVVHFPEAIWSKVALIFHAYESAPSSGYFFFKKAASSFRLSAVGVTKSIPAAGTSVEKPHLGSFIRK